MRALADVETEAGRLRARLDTDVYGACAAIADFADRYAADRELFYRAILLRRDLTITRGDPTAAQIAEAGAIVTGVLEDYRQQVAAGEPRALERHERVQQAREATRSLAIPDGVALSCDHLTKVFRSFTLSDVTFDVRLGEITGVLGRNGNGKTTLFRLVAGEMSPTSGSVSYPALAQSGSLASARRHVAYVPQDLPRWYGSLKSNLHYAAAVRGIRGRENEHEVHYIVERLGLSDELGKKWRELSGGFKLRFSLARAIIQKPKLLILDEPLANLDFETQETVLDDLRQLANSMRQPMAVLISSQHVHEIEEVADNIVFLSDGRVTYSGPTGDIGEGRAFNRFELGGSFDLTRLQSALSGAGVVSVHHSGVAFVVTTSRQCEARELLGRLLEAGLPFDYFRDISRSTKSLFQETAVATARADAVTSGQWAQ